LSGPSGAQVQIHVKLQPARSFHPGNTPGRKDEDRKPPSSPKNFSAELNRIPPKLRKQLLHYESQVLDWINADKENARLFTVQPLEALRKIGVDEETIAGLKALRDDAPSAQPDMPGVDLTRLTLSADPKGEQV
ncbi:MAG TPA: hypothetical protein VG106_06410, partial [Vicinamibacterales bacterium]|nr:hypothetical protein [Vicinamibacterales bacterium]